MQTADDEMTMYEYDGQEVELLGIVTQRVRVRPGKKMMANFVLEDLYAQMNVIAFPNVYSRSRGVFEDGCDRKRSAEKVTVGQNGIELLAGRIARYVPDDPFFAGKQLYVKVALE